MNRRSFLGAAAGVCASPLLRTPLWSASRPPNIVVILADDAGYDDFGCYGAAKPRTPTIDGLAAQGVRFTDAHSSSATCTPSRYAIMTGEYPWRRPGTGILPGDASLIIDPGRPTLPSVLRDAGYTTGCVGKWHLGLGRGNLNWNGDIQPGPLDVGFDYSFILPATGDRVPCVYVENRRVVGLNPKDPIRVSYRARIGTDPVGRDRPELLRMKLSHGHDQTVVNGISRIGYMTGGNAARWVDEDMAATITRKAVGFIEQNRAKPFFLYFATHDIHVPRVPNGTFRGGSRCGVRCDVIEEFDWSVGQIASALDRLDLSRDTLLIITSDNGPVVDDGYADRAVEQLNGHVPAGGLRGGKYEIYEGGTRVPLIARWPGRIQPGTSDALVCQIDWLRSMAALARREAPPAAGPDSENVLAAMLGETHRGRERLVEHADRLALRHGQWKLIEGKSPELYDLASDRAEKTNLAAREPERVRTMSAALTEIRSASRRS